MLIKNKLYSASRKLITLLNFKDSGFHIQLRGLQPPKTNCIQQDHTSIWHCHLSGDRSEINNTQPKPLTRTNHYTLNGGPIKAPEAPTVIIPIIKGVTPFSAHHNKAQKGPLIAMIETTRLWYVRLGHIKLDLLKKTALITKGMPDFSSIRPEHIACKSCNAAKLLQQPSSKAITNPPDALRRIKGDVFVIRPIPLNNKPYRLILVD